MKIEVQVSGTEPLVQALQALTAALSGKPVVENSDGPAKVVTLKEVRAKLQPFMKDGWQGELKQLFGKYGATRVIDIPMEKYADLIKDAEAILSENDHTPPVS